MGKTYRRLPGWRLPLHQTEGVVVDGNSVYYIRNCEYETTTVSHEGEPLLLIHQLVPRLRYKIVPEKKTHAYWGTYSRTNGKRSRRQFRRFRRECKDLMRHGRYEDLPVKWQSVEEPYWW